MLVRRSITRSRRRGAATVELALALPLLLSVAFGSIEIANGMFLKQSLTLAAHEAARVATSQQETSTAAIAAAQRLLTARNVQGATITVSPTVTAATVGGTIVTVTVSAQSSANSIGINIYMGNSTITSSVVMVRL